jgi:hypothetical protein
MRQDRRNRAGPAAFNVFPAPLAVGANGVTRDKDDWFLDNFPDR